MKRTVLLILAALTGFYLQACQSSKPISIPSNEQEKTIDGEFNDWSYKNALIEENSDFNYYATTDGTYLYVYVTFNNQFYNNSIEDVGFTIYMSHNKDNKKRLGITYPLGATNALREMPSTRKEYLDKPDWLNKPQNKELWEELKKDNFKRAMFTQTLQPKEPPQRLIVELPQLKAHGINVEANQTRRLTRLEYRIPLHESKTHQFAANPKDQQLYLGFAIEPPEFDLRDELDNNVERNLQSGYGGRTRNPNYYQVQRNVSKSMGEYSKWFHIDLSDQK